MELQYGRELDLNNVVNVWTMSPMTVYWQGAGFSSVPARQLPRSEDGPVDELKRALCRDRHGGIKGRPSLHNPFA